MRIVPVVARVESEQETSQHGATPLQAGTMLILSAGHPVRPADHGDHPVQRRHIGQGHVQTVHGVVTGEPGTAETIRLVLEHRATTGLPGNSVPGLVPHDSNRAQAAGIAGGTELVNHVEPHVDGVVVRTVPHYLRRRRGRQTFGARIVVHATRRHHLPLAGSLAIRHHPGIDRYTHCSDNFDVCSGEQDLRVGQGGTFRCRLRWCSHQADRDHRRKQRRDDGAHTSEHDASSGTLLG